MILNRILNVQTFQIITRCVRNKGPYFHEAASFPKIPLMLIKALHTSQVDGRQIVYKNYVEPAYEDHDHKNMRLGRPMSPHMSDYAPTLPSFTSIMQRACGVVLSFYTIMLASGSLFLSNGVDTYVSMIQSLNLGFFLVFILKLLLGFPFMFHYFIGIRFCLFNMVKLLDLKTAYSSARQAIIAAGVLTFFFALR